MTLLLASSKWVCSVVQPLDIGIFCFSNAIQSDSFFHKHLQNYKSLQVCNINDPHKYLKTLVVVCVRLEDTWYLCVLRLCIQYPVSTDKTFIYMFRKGEPSVRLGNGGNPRALTQPLNLKIELGPQPCPSEDLIGRGLIRLANEVSLWRCCHCLWSWVRTAVALKERDQAGDWLFRRLPIWCFNEEFLTDTIVLKRIMNKTNIIFKKKKNRKPHKQWKSALLSKYES